MRLDTFLRNGGLRVRDFLNTAPAPAACAAWGLTATPAQISFAHVDRLLHQSERISGTRCPCACEPTGFTGFASYPTANGSDNPPTHSNWAATSCCSLGRRAWRRPKGRSCFRNIMQGVPVCVPTFWLGNSSHSLEAKPGEGVSFHPAFSDTFCEHRIELQNIVNLC